MKLKFTINFKTDLVTDPNPWFDPEKVVALSVIPFTGNTEHPEMKFFKEDLVTGKFEVIGNILTIKGDFVKEVDEDRAEKFMPELSFMNPVFKTTHVLATNPDSETEWDTYHTILVKDTGGFKKVNTKVSLA